MAWWLRPEQPAAARRAAVLALWEGADTMPFPAEARFQIEAYIRRHIVGADGFTAEEIAAANARRNEEPYFDPYGLGVGP